MSNRLHVLVAEDHPRMRELLAALCESRGYRVTAVADGEAAVDAVARGGIDLVLMDIHMPKLDGCEATRRIRTAAGQAATVPIIAVTADCLEATRERCRDAGMDDFLVKPVDTERLIDRIDGVRRQVAFA
jgi:two-component system, sensor histidine kinase